MKCSTFHCGNEVAEVLDGISLCRLCADALRPPSPEGVKIMQEAIKSAVSKYFPDEMQAGPEKDAK